MPLSSLYRPPLQLESLDSFALISDAREAEMYRCCFWPLFVWKRSCDRAKAVRRELANRIHRGVSRLRSFRLWRSVTREARQHSLALEIASMQTCMRH